MNQMKQIIRFPALQQKVPVSRTTIFRWERDGVFPKHIQLGAKSTGWLLSEVEDWIASKENV